MFRALVVDDVQVIRQSIAGQVDESVHPVIVSGLADNGEKALEWLAVNYADICITDIKMSMLDGFELMKRIKDQYSWMTCVVISGYDDFSYARTSIQLEALDYILKPVEQESIDNALKKSVEKIENTRLTKSASLLFSHMSECTLLLNKWTEYLKLYTGESRQLIDETTDKLCEISRESCFLLEYLAQEWLSLVSYVMKVCKHDKSVEAVCKESFEPRIIKNVDIKGYYLSRCAELLKCGMAEIGNEFDACKGNQQTRIVEKLTKYIANHYMQSDLTLQELADHIPISKNHMSNIFKQETGTTIWNYIIDLRMKKAKELLAETNVKNLEVALEVGYTDYTHFSRLFKEYCGISAQEYRRKAQG